MLLTPLVVWLVVRLGYGYWDYVRVTDCCCPCLIFSLLSLEWVSHCSCNDCCFDWCVCCRIHDRAWLHFCWNSGGLLHPVCPTVICGGCLYSPCNTYYCYRLTQTYDVSLTWPDFSHTSIPCATSTNDMVQTREQASCNNQLPTVNTYLLNLDID